MPRGSHRWRKFVRPAELARDLRLGGARTSDISGLAYDPLDGGFRQSADGRVNYALVARKAEPGAP